MGYPFPEVYICQGELDTGTLKKVDYVVDGQQRLTTIKDYIDGSFDVKSVKPYKALTDGEREHFLYYDVVVRNLGIISDEEIKNVFNRLNRTDYTLNSVELIYAQYQGEFISVAKRLSSEFTSFFELIMGEKSISRMNDIDFVLQIMSTLENGIYFSSDSKVELFVDLYNETYKNKDSMYQLLSKCFTTYSSLMLKKDSVFYKKAACFSLLTEMCKANDSVQNANYLVPKLIDFEKRVYANKDKDLETNEFAKFYNFLFQGTASKTARDYRGEMIRKYIFSAT